MEEEAGPSPTQAEPGNGIHTNKYVFRGNKGIRGRELPLLYVLILQLLKRHADDGFVSFYSVDIAIKRLELSHDERVAVMKELEEMGVVQLANFKGWKIENAGER